MIIDTPKDSFRHQYIVLDTFSAFVGPDIYYEFKPLIRR